MCFTEFKDGVPTSALTRVRTPFSHLGNGCTLSPEIYYVAGEVLAKHFAQVVGEVHLQGRAYALLFRIVGTTGGILLKFDVWVVVNWLYHYTCYGWGTSARVFHVS